jgi:hypothetical protein
VEAGSHAVAGGAEVANVAVDAAVGFVPVVGDVFDVAFNASTRNLRILGIEPIASR